MSAEIVLDQLAFLIEEDEDTGEIKFKFPQGVGLTPFPHYTKEEIEELYAEDPNAIGWVTQKWG